MSLKWILCRLRNSSKNLDVTFEIVSPIAGFEDDFFVSNETREMKVSEPQIIKEEQVSFTFDLPVVKEEKMNDDRVLFELSNETKEIVVNQPVHVVPMTELNENGIIKYSLEEYMELENDLLNSKPVAQVAEEPVAEELKITMKKVDAPVVNSFSNAFEDVSPTEMTIEESLKFRADERRRKMKEFNYKFHNSTSKIDEYEKEPAYKRSGIDISGSALNNNHSRMSLGTDSNDDLQLRSNNSFLHDNVD
jgi:cell division protein FtsZ